MKHQYASLILLGMLSACADKVPSPKSGPLQYVEVERVVSLQKSQVGRFSGRAMKISNHDFLIEAFVPEQVVNGIRIGNEVSVMLPLVNMGMQKASVVKIGKDRVFIKLNQQIHDLSDQEIEIQLPLKNATMYEIPFSSIYSPMGGDAFVFTVETNFVSRKKVDVIQVVGNNKILVMASELNNGDQIVRRGLDNLVEGDKVVSEGTNEF